MRIELQQKLRAFLNGPLAHTYPYDRFPNVVLPGSVAIMPKASVPLDLYDGAYDDHYHLNHRSTYNPRTHSYNNYLQLDSELNDGDEEITVE